MGIYGLFRCLSLHVIIRYFDKKFNFVRTMRNSLITVFFNGATPFSTGGQPVQVYFLSKEGISIERSTAIVIQNFIVYQFVLILFGIFAITCNFAFGMFDKVPLLSKLTFFGFLINFIVMVILLIISYTHKLDHFILSKCVDILHKFKLVKNKTRTKKNLNKKIKQFYNSGCELKKHKLIYLKCFIYNFFGFIFLYSIPYILILSVSNNISMDYLTSFVGISYVMLIGSFVPIPGGSGGLEYAFSKFFGLYIIDYITSSLIIIWRFITYYFGMIIGAIALATTNTKRFR